MGVCRGGEERETGGGAKACEPVGDTTADSLAGEEGEGAEAISFNSFFVNLVFFLNLVIWFFWN